MAKAQAKTKRTIKKGGQSFDDSWHATFLKLFSESLNVTLAANGAGVSRSVVYAHRVKSPEFAAQFEDAREEAIEQLEAAAYHRARSVSDTLAIFLLKAHKPDKYHERVKGTNVNVDIDLSSLSDGQLDKFERYIIAGEPAERAYALARQT